MTTPYYYHRPTFDPGDQCAGGCGYAPEHCHCPGGDQPDLFGGAA